MATPQTTETTQQNATSTAAPHAQQAPETFKGATFQSYMYSTGYGQPFQAYQGYPPTGRSQNAPANKAWEITKIVLHGLGLVLSIIGFGLAISLLKHTEDDDDDNYYSLLIVVGNCPVSAFAFLWSLAEIITRAARKFKAGIHPGAHVGVSLIIWLTAAVLGGLFGALNSLVNDEETCSFNDRDDDFDNSDCSEAFSGRRKIAIAASAFTIAIAVLHFALFIGACVDTHQRNTAAARTVMVVAHPQHWPAMNQRWQPMQQNDPSVPQQIGHTFPPENRSPTAGEEGYTGNGKQPERGHGITEHYAPGSSSHG